MFYYISPEVQWGIGRAEKINIRRKNTCNLETVMTVVSLERIVGLVYFSLMICFVTLDILHNCSVLAISEYLFKSLVSWVQRVWAVEPVTTRQLTAK